MWRILGFFVACLSICGLKAAPIPGWWKAPDTQIIQDGLPQSDSSPITLGQLKFVATQAKKHLDASLVIVGGAGLEISNSVSAFKPVVGTDYTSQQLQQIRKDNFAPASLAQLKAVALPFYDRLNAVGFNTKQNLKNRGFADKWSGANPWAGSYPWNPATPVAENMVPASLAQLKMVFSFDLTNFQAGDTDGNQIADSWEIQYFGGLGTNVEADADSDGVSNLKEFQRGLSPKNPDSDFDGIGDVEEIARGTNPLDSASKDNKRIAYFPFDASDWQSAEGALPSETTGSQVDGFKGKALLIDGVSEVHVYPWLRADGRPNYSIRQGTVRIWFKPNWSSPGMSNYWSRLFQLGMWTGDASLGAIIFHFKVGEPGVSYTTHDGNGHAATGDFTLATNSIVSGKWHQIAISYSPTNRKLYFNGALIANQSVAWTYDPDIQDIIGWGLRFGNDTGSYLNGALNGALDEVEIFNYQLTDADVLSNYTANAPGVDTEPDGLPDAWEQANFGGLSQNGSGNDDADGLTNLQEYQYRTNPQIADTDNDGIIDGTEVSLGFNPVDPVDALRDFDGDRIPNVFEIANNSDPKNSASLSYPHIYVYKEISSESESCKRTIQAAINAMPTVSQDAARYSIIEVFDESYDERISINNRRILLIGQENTFPEIHPLNNSGDVVTINYGPSALHGLTITGRKTDNYSYSPSRSGAGVFVNVGPNRQATIENCVIRQNQGDQGGGVNLGSGNLRIAYSNIVQNVSTANLESDEGGSGVYTASPTNKLSIENSIVWNTETPSLEQVRSLYPETVKVVGSVILNGEYGSISANPYFDRYDHLPSYSGARYAGAPLGGTAFKDMDSENRPAYPDSGIDQFVDTDHDGLADWWEWKWFSSLKHLPGGDNDSDRLTNWYEYLLGFNPNLWDTTNPWGINGNYRGDLWNAAINTSDKWYPEEWKSDPDGDGLISGLELAYGTNLGGRDTNNDGIDDGYSLGMNIIPTVLDPDGDGLTSEYEIGIGLNPFVADTDGDGYADNVDAFPLDFNKNSLTPMAPDTDTTAPSINLTKPPGAVNL